MTSFSASVVSPQTSSSGTSSSSMFCSLSIFYGRAKTANLTIGVAYFSVSTVEKRDGKMATTKQDFLNNPTWVKRIEEFFNVKRCQQEWLR